ncbi:KilA-N domain-containing protein, partial [Ascoidea rubescens DSM 1968]
KPRLTTTYWEDENTICYQVECRNVTVSRRGDNDFINGTKLLNVTGMTRGRRDGILKTEKTRFVIKIGAMNLKGVWIPYDRAFELARNEGIADLLYPLFVTDIKGFYTKSNAHV